MYKRVLVPLDGSPVAEAIVPFILQIAGPLDMAVRLLAVVEPVQPTMVEDPGFVMIQDLDARTRSAEEYLAPIAAELRGRGIEVEWEVRRGSAASTILAIAKSWGADLIAMTTHGRSGLGRLLFGSVAEHVLRHADVPVFLMRQTEAQLAARAAKEMMR
ncbi:MAG TPA: universal stress protein [Methylomirabilota bacterium]|nr:universal stress protein [Methylomirabilota bacterium]